MLLTLWWFTTNVCFPPLPLPLELLLKIICWQAIQDEFGIVVESVSVESQENTPDDWQSLFELLFPIFKGQEHSSRTPFSSESSQSPEVVVTGSKATTDTHDLFF